ncbi:apolipoprotein O-like [Acyrthosiphon pisum]|uniref:MICOS complex subunit n=2 Tax=Acyrthosiphon pisum TaxID=7029 RepID=C4WRU0_ACYPI|nr:apolipoprotein O-like [Acyrthosiphon pisum]BAH70610.1 ACYPI002863 [Acyrthosiphon pisum]|eukprot:NP_001155499.1 apolipoprotein O-like [Acyrthosiphon pisum]
MKFKNIIKNRTATNGFLLTAYAYTVMPVVLAKDEQEPKLVRPRDLPIYPDESKEMKTEKEDNWKPTVALGSIQKVREEIVSLNQRWSKVKDRIYIFLQTGVSHTESFVDDLRQENNSALRAGFVAGSGLAGLLIAARKGKFKKLVYATTGATSAFYVGYPKESEEATKVIKRYSIVSYHLINNVTKDLTGFELPSLPLPKAESQSDNSEDSSKPDLKELFFSLIDYVKEPLESFKQMVFNGKNGPDDKGK